jgi:hypothetical protein
VKRSGRSLIEDRRTDFRWKDNERERLTWKEKRELTDIKFVYYGEELPVDLPVDFASVNFSVRQSGGPWQLQHHSKRGYGHKPEKTRATCGLGRLEGRTRVGREAACPFELCLFCYFTKTITTSDFALRPELKDQFDKDNSVYFKDREFRIEVDFPYSKDLPRKLIEATRLSLEALRELDPYLVEELEQELRDEEAYEQHEKDLVREHTDRS